MQLILVSSNEFKLKEFKRMGLGSISIEKGKDLKEVDSNPVDVILYKALEAGKNRIVEDTSLEVEGQEIGANIRWLLDDLPSYTGKNALWKVLLGVNDGEHIHLFEGIIEGTIEKRFDEMVGFGFDSVFVPVGTDKTLYELEQMDDKDSFSARKKAIESLLNKTPILSRLIKDIPIWDGKYQQD